MGNLPLSAGFYTTDATTFEQSRFVSKKISRGMTYYCSPFPEAAVETLCPATDCETPETPPPGSRPCSSPPIIVPSETLPRGPPPSQNTQQSDSAPAARPLLLFLSWLGANPTVVYKYIEMYLERGMDVLLVQSNVMHFLWPRWGLEYGLEVLKVLEEPRFSARPVLVYASSIGGYTFTQILTHVSQGEKQHAGLAHRVVGHIYDSLVAGTLEHMAIGLGKTLVPCLEGLVKNTALLYFWLFKSSTTDLYNNSIRVFNNSPITAPALFFFSENDALCDPVAIENVIDSWRKRGVAVQSRKWKESIHAAHMRCHPEEYHCTLQGFLNSLPLSALRVKT